MGEKEYSSIGFAEAKDRLSALTTDANETGEPFLITKNNKPWVEVRPLASRSNEKSERPISISPSRRELKAVDLDELFGDYEGGYKASEDGFSAPVGGEEL